MPIDDMPEWRKIVTIEDFVLAVRDTLVVWLLMHTNAECWANEWAMDEVEWAFKESKGVISNDWFHFDWKQAVYEEMAKDWLPTTDKCPKCSALVLEGWELDCNCVYELEDEDEELEAVPCTEDDLEDIVWFMKDIEAEPDLGCTWEALVGPGFRTYQDALSGTIQGYVEEMEEAVKKLDEAIGKDERQDMLVMSREATRIYHVNGEVMEDYGERIGLEFRDVDTIRDEGFDALFERDELREFLEGN